MGFSLSPAVVTREIDLSAVVGAQVSTLAAFAGKFQWGPVNQPMLIADEPNLVRTFGYPDNYNATDFFTIASFFGYTSGAWVTRIGNNDMTNAVYPTQDSKTYTILNDYNFNEQTGTLSTASFIARYPGIVGNAFDIAVCSSEKQFAFTFKSEIEGKEVHESGITFNLADENGKGIKTKEIPYTGADATEFLAKGDYLIIDSVKYMIEDVTVSQDANSGTVLLDRIYVGDANPDEIYRYWRFYENFTDAPKENHFHLAIIDRLGYFQQKGSVLETHQNLSVEISDLDDENNSAYWENVINKKSNFIFAGEATPLQEDANISQYASMTGGTAAELTVGLDEYIKAYELYLNAETYDCGLMIAGNAITSNDTSGAVLANFIIHSLAEKRKDTLAFVSPPLEAVLNNRGKEALACTKARKLLGSSSYATMDCNWKQIYDKYNDTFRWVPCNGDHAGLYSLNDLNRDPWVSAAGTSKGRMRNVVKFAWNPDKTSRDLLYTNDINPMFVMSIAGPVLFGDKTLLGKNTALSRNNVRRLLIVLEKAIATAAVDLLFEFNDEFTQRRFVSMVTPFLQDAKGRRGLTSFKVIADGTVNTPQVVQNNSFVGEIYIKPNYSINDIRLDFVVVNASAEFEEVIGSA